MKYHKANDMKIEMKNRENFILLHIILGNLFKLVRSLVNE